MNPYEAPNERGGAVPDPENLAAGWRTYFRVHFILVALTGLLVVLNGHRASVKPPAVVIVPLGVALYASLIFLPVSPLIDIYLLFKVLRGEKKRRMLFTADAAVTVGHFFFISPIVS